MNGLEQRTVHSYDGTPLYYTVQGEGPIDFLLADGIGCDGFIWRYLAPELLRRGRVIHLHMRGHGRSGSPVDGTRIEIADFADDWQVVLDACGCEQGIALGHSMGVQVSLELWHRHPTRVSGLVLFCGSFENPVSTFHDGTMAARLLPAFQRATRAGGDRLRRAWRRAISLPLAYHVARATELDPDLARREDMDRYLDHLSRMDPALFFRMLGGAAAHSARAYLSAIDVPVLVVAGSKDRFTPARLSVEMADRIPGSQSVVVEEGTHTAPIEQPVRVNLSVTNFLEQNFQA